MSSSNQPAFPQFRDIKSVHIIGVCGTLMGAFASFLKRQGIEVTGSDQNVYPPMSDVLEKAGVQLFSGYRAENLLSLSEKPDLVVIGNVIRRDNPEARAAIDGGYVYSSLPEAMENLMLRETCNIVVSGTHGKTTTSSILAHVLSYCGKDPNYFIGGVSADLPFSFHAPRIEKEAPFVLEGDEYDTAFWDKVPKFTHYLPDHVILTSVEYDHADIYPDVESLLKVFRKLIAMIRPEGKLIACVDYPHVRDLIREAKVPVITYGNEDSEDARFTPANIITQGEETRFKILDQGQVVDELVIRMSGRHNVLNTLAVWIECTQHLDHLGFSLSDLRSAFEAFRGVKRRQEVRGEIQNILVIDDFAHHPTAVRETLQGLKARYAPRRLAAVFEPRSATSRRKVFQKDYANAFSSADLVFIANPFDQEAIPPADRFSSEELVRDLTQSNVAAQTFTGVEEGLNRLLASVQPGDVVAVLSNGGFDGLIPKFLERLNRRAFDAQDEDVSATTH